MKRYGFKLPTIDVYGSRFNEHRTLGLMAGLALGGLFSEAWIITLGLVFFVFGCLAEIWGKTLLLINLVIPVSALVGFAITLAIQNKILPPVSCLVLFVL